MRCSKRESLMKGGTSWCVNCVCVWMCTYGWIPERMYECVCVHIYIPAGVWLCWCVSGMYTTLTELTRQKGELALSVGPDSAVCVVTCHFGQSRLFGACEHYCNPNIIWNPDLTEVIKISVCVQSHFKGVPAGEGTPVGLQLNHKYAKRTSQG